MFPRIVAAVLLLGVFPSTLACPQHDYHQNRNVKRADAQNNTTWAYEASYDWGRLSEDYATCQIGTQQSPIPLLLTQGLSLNHIPSFNYQDSSSTAGQLQNWGYGPAFTLAHPEGDFSGLPSMSFEENGLNETVYLSGWHIHAPADHTVQGDRSKAELHFVHTDAKGNARVVLAFRIDPGNAESSFFRQFPELISFRDTETRINTTFDPSLALNEVNRFSEFWTYKGSLTSPPCTEGLRWFVARNIMFLGVEQMQALLGASIYSARAEQEVWLHQINV